jgi:hypothetical protein
MSQPSLSPATRKPSAVIGWYPATPATDVSTLDMANARQVALWVRLRNHYWLSACKPLTPLAVGLQRRKMAGIDPLDVLTDEQTAELLSEHYGFRGDAVGGWSIPDLQDHYSTALGAVESVRKRASAAGRASASARAAGKAPAIPPVPPPVAPESPEEDAEDF